MLNQDDIIASVSVILSNWIMKQIGADESLKVPNIPYSIVVCEKHYAF